MEDRFASYDDYSFRHLIKHLLQSQRWSQIEKLLTSLEFIHAGCSAGMIDNLLQDCNQATRLNPDLHAISQMRRALILELPGLASRPELAMQLVYNRLAWFGDLESILSKQLEIASSRLAELPFWIRAAAALPAATPGSDLHIPFAFFTNIQSLAPDGSTIAIASMLGDVNIYSLGAGTLLEKRSLDSVSIAAVAICENPRRLAWMDTDGSIHSSQCSKTLAGRSAEERLLYHAQGGVVGVCADHALVAWQPEQDKVDVLVGDLAVPLLVLRFSADGNQITYAAGYAEPTIGILVWDGSRWLTSSVQYDGPTVVDADFDPQENTLLVLRKDRSIQILDVPGGQTLAHLFYEKRGGFTGAPACCACGLKNTAARQIFFCTKKGQLGAWNWQTDLLEKYEDCFTGTDSHSFALLRQLPQQENVFYSTERVGSTAAPARLLTGIAQHRSEVLDCLITPTGKVVSAGKQDHSLAWFSVDGLQPLGVPRIHREIRTIAACPGSDDILIGDARGWVWVQPADRDVDQQEIEHVFEGPVRSAFLVDRQTAIAADETGRILRVQIIADQVEVLRRSQGLEEIRKIIPAGKHGLFWSLYYKIIQADRHSILALHQKDGGEEIIFSSQERISDLAVSADGEAVCLVGRTLQVLRKRSQGWKVGVERGVPEAQIDQAAFVGRDDSLLAITLSAAPYWLEIWKVDRDLMTVAATPLASPATCFSVSDNRMLIGCKSGCLVSLCLNKKEG